MRIPGHNLLLAVAALWLAVGLVVRAQQAQPPGETVAQRAAPPRACTPAAAHTVRLPAEVAVDEVRVVVDGRSPVAGAAIVRIGAGPFDRVVRVHGATSKAVAFHPALTGAEFDVVVDPVFHARADACVDRVELRHRGATVAVVRP